MFYGNEMHFLCEVFKKSRVNVSFVSVQDKLKNLLDSSFLTIIGNHSIFEKRFEDISGKLKQNVLYKNKDALNICYIYLILPDMPKESVMFIGPFIHNPLRKAELLKFFEKASLSPKNHNLFNEYYQSIPVIPESSHLFVMLDTFCEKIWGVNKFSFHDIEQERFLPISPINQETSTELDQTLASIKLMEQRYNYENRLIEAVRLGQIHKADTLLAGLDEVSFKKRTQDPLRNMKNYCIIMNTLFRKAAESGGVMPIYLDKVSTDFAIKIEQISSLFEIKNLMKDIFRSYCRLVRKHAMKNYSPIVQKTIIFIESDLSANLTLNSLSKMHNVSGGYLSTIFKKETGKNLTEYIREKRMKHAEHLLSSTHLQIQTIALHCGIMDVQYFSKQFKKHTGKTPKEYREVINNPL